MYVYKYIYIYIIFHFSNSQKLVHIILASKHIEII